MTFPAARKKSKSSEKNIASIVYLVMYGMVKCTSVDAVTYNIRGKNRCSLLHEIGTYEVCSCLKH